MDEYAYLRFPTEAVHVDPSILAHLPESARTVFEAIHELGPVTHADLRRLTNMPPRTIRFAVKRLKDEGIIDARCSLRDCRTCYFFVHKRHVDEAALAEARRRAEHDAGVENRLMVA